MSDIKVKTSTNQILVRVADQNAIKVLSATNGLSLSNIADIDLSAISDKSILRYNASLGKWETFVNLDIWYVDNITIDGNSISSSNINGNIILDPNGTGKVSIPDDTYLSFGDNFDSLIRYNETDSDKLEISGSDWNFLSGVSVSISDTTSSSSKSTGAFVVSGGVGIGSDLNVGGNLNLNGSNLISGNLHVSGTSEFVGVVTFRGGTINLGDSDTDDVVVGGDFASSLFPTTDNVYSIGSTSKMWRNIYLREKVVSGSLFLDFPTSGIHTRGVSYFGSDGKLISTNEPEIGYASTSNYFLTTNEANVPIWTDALDGGSY